MSTTTTRDDLAQRIAVIDGRITSRQAELADIAARQLEAAEAGTPPDRKLSTSKAVLLDEQDIDEQTVTPLRARLAQLDADAAAEAAAAAKRESDLKLLARLRGEMAEAAAIAAEEASAFPNAFEDALDALRHAGNDLRARLATIKTQTHRAQAWHARITALAASLDEPGAGSACPNHVARLAGYYPFDRNPGRAKVFTQANIGDSLGTVDAIASEAVRTMRVARLT